MSYSWAFNQKAIEEPGPSPYQKLINGRGLLGLEFLHIMK